MLVDSESAWASVREQLVRESGGRWHQGAQEEMMGMSSGEWSRYMRSALGVPMEPAEISAAVVQGLEAHYRRRVPLLPHAVEAVRALAERWPLALAEAATPKPKRVSVKSNGQEVNADNDFRRSPAAGGGGSGGGGAPVSPERP